MALSNLGGIKHKTYAPKYGTVVCGEIGYQANGVNLMLEWL